ncbi:hypothetical protein AYO42_05740 [Rhizomicrobium sp. SCGC AG-212-E05]|nr:hypothetical protein AYO42_05740 [Rhizomicrobium sp. SCGC AG-212-E05]
MKTMGPKIFLAMLVAGALVTPAHAQRNSNYAVKEMNFDLWCQLQAGLPAERCDKRTAQDEAAFNSYRDKVEAYEIPYLQRKNAATRLDRNILHADPMSPLRNDPAAQRQDLGSGATTSTLPAR